MTNRMRIGVFWMLAQGLAGCGGESSVLPTAPTSPTPPVVAWTNPFLVPGERWNLTTTTTSVTGPDACLSPAARALVGHSADWQMAIQRSGESIHVTIADAAFTEIDEYAGTVVAGEFSLTGVAFPGAYLCGGVRVDYLATPHVSGRFSTDGRILTAEATDSYRLSSGETLNWNSGWSATQQ